MVSPRLQNELRQLTPLFSLNREVLVNRSPGGFFTLRLIDPLHRVEALIASFTAIGPDVRRKQDLIRYAWPRASDSGGFAVRALGEITPASRSDCN